MVAVGPVLSSVLSAVEGLDVTVLYCTTVAPFDVDTLAEAVEQASSGSLGEVA